MQFVLIIRNDESVQPTQEELFADPVHQEWLADVEGRGVLRSGQRLRPSGEAARVRVRGDETLVSDGPFAETKDVVGGVTLIECADLTEAIDIAARHPFARFGTVEVRPVWER